MLTDKAKGVPFCDLTCKGVFTSQPAATRAEKIAGQSEGRVFHGRVVPGRIRPLSGGAKR